MKEDQVRDYVKQYGRIPDGAGESVLALIEWDPSKSVSAPVLEEAVQRGAIRMVDVVQWLDHSFYSAIQLVAMWPCISVDQAVAVAALRKLLEKLLIDYRDFDEGSHGKCGQIVEVLIGLSRSDEETASITHLLAAALRAERQRDDRTHFFAQPLMTWLEKLGDTDAFQIEDMEPWEGMLLHWKAEGYSWKDAIVGLTEAGAIDPVSPEVLSQWLAKESQSLDRKSYNHAFDTFMSIPDSSREHGERCVFASSLKENDYCDKIFEQLGRALRPAVAIEAAWDKKEYLLLHYTFQGRERLLDLGDPDNELDRVAIVGREFNKLMQEIERPERAFMMIEPPHGGGDLAAFLCASDQRFAEIRDRLRLPFIRPEDYRYR